MKYVGGKARLAKHIVAHFPQRRIYIEPFVGSAAVLERVRAEVRIAADAHPHLIAMYQALQQGWVPPDVVTPELYADLRAEKDGVPDPLVAFAGFACSFGAKWFGGYARGGTRNYAAEGCRNLAKIAPHIQDVTFLCCSYDQIDINDPTNTVIYCDPPYEGTQGYGGTAPFNHEAFWAWCLRQHERGAAIFVSEFNAPDTFKCIWEKERAASLDLNTGGKRSVERLFVPR